MQDPNVPEALALARNAVRATAFFRLPPEHVVELGVQVEM